jgi:hypothetical protein
MKRPGTLFVQLRDLQPVFRSTTRREVAAKRWNWVRASNVMYPAFPDTTVGGSVSMGGYRKSVMPVSSGKDPKNV